MCPQLQKFTVAELQGWKPVSGNPTSAHRHDLWQNPNERLALWGDELPDYVNDEQAIRKVIKTLDFNERGHFGRHVVEILFGYSIAADWTFSEQEITALVIAPADVLTKAYLQTKNKWTD